MRSRRIFNQVIITDVPFYNDNRKEVVALLNVHGWSIKSMRIESKMKTTCKIEARDWLKIFKAVPNLESLDLDIENLIIVDWLNCEILQKLKSLTINLNNCEIKEFFGYFRTNSLKELTVKSHWNEFDGFINLQQTIADLTIHESNFNQMFDKLNLENFTVIVEMDHTASPAHSNFTHNPTIVRSPIFWRNPVVTNVSAMKPNVPNDKLISLIYTHRGIKKLSVVNLI